MRRFGKRWACVLIGLLIQLPVGMLLLEQVLDMHNRFSTLLSILAPYAAILDRTTNPPALIGLTVVIVTLFQYPLYGVITGEAWSRNKLRPALSGLVTIHAIAAAIAIYMKTAKI
jgi:hypothetical protein